MSNNWGNFKVLCGWSGCGHPACVRLKVAEIAGSEVGREGSGRRQAEHPWKPSCFACPRAKLYPFSASASRKRPHVRWSPPPPIGSESKECRPGGPGALSVRASTWQYGMLALLVLGRQWKWLPGLIRRKPTKGLASQYSGKGAGRGVWIPRVLGPLLTLWVTVNLLPDGSPQFCHLTSGDTTPYPACFTN